MLKRLKHFLWSNRLTKRVYRTLWHWKHEGLDAAAEYWTNGEKKKKKKRKHKKKQINTYHYNILHSTWRVLGPDNNLMEKINFYAKSDWCWRNEDKKIWLMYTSCLLEIGQNEKAKQILTQYMARYGTKNLERFLPVAVFAKELGVSSEEIEQANEVFKVLEYNSNTKLFNEIVKGKNIAIVGNAGCELGQKKGKEIDGHDIVIRFNNYPNDYSEDYGSKTDIWVRCANISVQDRPDISQYKLVIWEPDYWHMDVQYDHLSILYKEITDFPEKIIYIDKHYKSELYAKSSIMSPTTGCFILWMLYKACGTFQNIDLYGFSFPYEAEQYQGHYYDELSVMNIVHNMNLERSFLRKLYYENGGRPPVQLPPVDDGTSESLDTDIKES